MSGCHLHLREVAEALGGRLLGADGAFDGVGTDTRSLQPGQLFVALRGPNYDAHDYIAAAAARGAVAALVAREVKTELPQIVVADTLAALGQLAAQWRARFDIPLIEITGSNGKTTVKEMLTAILSQRHEVLATPGNFNNEIGLPLTLLRLDDRHQAAVIEAGASKPGDIAYLTRIAAPSVSVLTNAAGAHLEGFGSLDMVARSKGEIFEHLGEGGTAVLNADDAHAELWRALAGGHRVITFALDSAADVRGQWWPQEVLRNTLEITTPEGEVSVALPLPGRHNAMNALAATAAALAAGSALDEIRAGLESLRPVPGRLCWKAGVNGARLLDDTYNANPASLAAALEVLVAAPGEHWLALGDMAELGGDAEALHAQAGERAARAGVTRLYAVGELSRQAVAAFVEHGSGVGLHFGARDDLLEQLQADLRRGVTLLVKGSRAAHMDAVVDALTEETA